MSERAYRDGIGKRLGALEDGISATKKEVAQIRARALTTDQKQAIKAAIEPYAGQKVLIQCHHWNFEAMPYANEFQKLFEEAGWECSPVANVIVPFDFYNVRLGIGDKGGSADSPEVPAPEAFLPLYRVLTNLELMVDNGQYQRSFGVETGTIVLQIGANRSRADEQTGRP